jgi:hypothetical protein
MAQIKAQVQERFPDENLEPSALVAEAEAIIARAQPLIEAARVIVESTRQRQREEIGQLRGEIDDTRDMIREISEELERIQSPLVAREERRSARPPISRQAQEVLESDPLFIDYETTGLSKRDKVVEVAVTDVEGRVLMSTLVNPGCHIPAEATAVNGVSDTDVVDAPMWEDIAPRLEALIGGRVVVAHNAKFEAKFTPKEWNVKWVCSKELADSILGKAEYWEIMHDRRLGGSLEARLCQCGLEPGPEHSAAGDDISALRLVMYLAGDDRPVELKYE